LDISAYGTKRRIFIVYLRCTQISVSSDGISGHLCSRPTICPVSMIVNYEIPPIFLPIAQKVSYKPQVWVPHLFTHIPCTYRAGSLRSPRPRPITASGGCSYSSRAVTLKILQKNPVNISQLGFRAQGLKLQSTWRA